MDISLETSDLLYLITCFVGFIVGGILISHRGWRYSRFNYLLGFSFACLSTAIFIGFLIRTDLILRFPFPYRYGNLFVLLCMPFSYMYVRGVVGEKGPSRTDIWLFIPTVFYIVDFFPTLILPGSEKIQLIEAVSDRGGGHLTFDEGWITPPDFHLFFRHIAITIFWLLQLMLLLGIRRSEVFLTDNKHWFYWIWAFQIHQLLYFVPFFIYVLSPEIAPVVNYSEVFAICALLILYLYLFYRPAILYGISGFMATAGSAAPGSDTKETPEYVSGRELTDITERLDHLMHEQKPFLNPEYTLDNMARDIEVSPWLLSNILNKSLGTNFNRYLNTFRIQHCLQLLEDGAYRTKSIEGIARECGFNNRNSFTQSFKLLKKQTPSAYIREEYPG